MSLPMRKVLVLLRHAKSDWSGHEADIDRPLAPRGRRQAPEAGRWMERHLERVDLAVVSPAERARRTWEYAAAELSEPPLTRIDDRLYAASCGDLLGVVRDLTDDRETVVMVGHNPGLEDLASALVGEWVSLPTSALAVIALPSGWSSAGQAMGELQASGRPPGGPS